MERSFALVGLLPVFFHCVYLWFLFYSLLVMVSDFEFYSGTSGVYVVS